MPLEILDIAARPDLKPAWRDLFDGYSTFYKRQLTDPVAEAVWAWLTDPGHGLSGRPVRVAGTPVGRRRPGPDRACAGGGPRAGLAHNPVDDGGRQLPGADAL